MPQTTPIFCNWTFSLRECNAGPSRKSRKSGNIEKLDADSGAALSLVSLVKLSDHLMSFVFCPSRHTSLHGTRHGIRKMAEILTCNLFPTSQAWILLHTLCFGIF